MRSIVTGIALAALCAAVGCTNEKKTQPAPAAQTLPISEPAVPPAPEAIVSDNIFIRPTFDAEGTQTSAKVSVGRPFNIYIHAETNDIAANLAQFRMAVPAGVQVLGEERLMQGILILGTWAEHLSITYPCQGGKFPLIKFVCLVDETFRGGIVETLNFEAARDYIGFIACGEGLSGARIKAEGAKATLSRE